MDKQQRFAANEYAELSNQAQQKVWRCTRVYTDWEGGATKEVKYAKTCQDMLILKDQEYDCVEIKDE